MISGGNNFSSFPENQLSKLAPQTCAYVLCYVLSEGLGRGPPWLHLCLSSHEANSNKLRLRETDSKIATVSKSKASERGRQLVWWRSGNAFHPINKVTLCRAWLVLGCVTACGQVNHLGM